MRQTRVVSIIAVTVFLSCGLAVAQPVTQHGVIGRLTQFDLSANEIAVETLGRAVEHVTLTETTYGWWKTPGASTPQQGSIVLVIFRHDGPARVALYAHNVAEGPLKKSEGTVSWFQPSTGTLILRSTLGREEVYRIQNHAFVNTSRGGSRVSDDTFKPSDPVRVYFTSEGSFSYAHLLEKVSPAETTP